MTAELPVEAWAMALLRLKGMGPNRVAAVLERCEPSVFWQHIIAGEPVPIEGVSELSTSTWRASARAHDVEAAWREVISTDVRVLRRGTPAYPVRLASDPEPPYLLFEQGRPFPDQPTVAIVGTRTCSAYGKRVAHELGSTLAAAGVSVVSGLAIGIDAAAHRGALAVDGAPPVGVVGSGLDVVYPRRNARLWDQVRQRGTLLSEAPLGIGPEPWRFPARNRIVAGLADAVVVVESALQGGSLITVDEAARRDVPVGAVPGPVTSGASAGTNGLIADGAVPVLGVDDVLLMIDHVAPRSDVAAFPAESELRAELGAVLDTLGWEPRTLDDLCALLGADALEVAPKVEALVAAAVVRRTGAFLERI